MIGDVIKTHVCPKCLILIQTEAIHICPEDEGLRLERRRKAIASATRKVRIKRAIRNIGR